MPTLSSGLTLIVGSAVCAAGGATLISNPLMGIGLIMLGGVVNYWSFKDE